MFLSALSSLMVAQLIKAVISLFRFRAKSLRDVFATLMWRTGGMPSSHAALTVSLCTAFGAREGMGSSVFVLSLFFCLVVMRDALGVRRSAGLIARAFNQVGRELNEKHGIAFTHIKEVHGHTPTEVVVGSLLGFFIALAFSFL